MLWDNPSVCCESALLSLVNNQADCPTARQDKVRQESQTKNYGKKDRELSDRWKSQTYKMR